MTTQHFKTVLPSMFVLWNIDILYFYWQICLITKVLWTWK